MNPTAKIKLIMIVTAIVMLLSKVSISSTTNLPAEQEASIVAEEVKVMITVATGIIGALQPIINAGQPDASKVEKSHLLQTFLGNYEKKTGMAFKINVDGLLGESRREFFESIKTVLEDHEQVLSVGGEDSFVPAYFRSEVFAEFNERLGGRVKGYATNRDEDLLNPDWSIDALMDYSLFAYYIQERLSQQQTEPMLEKIAGRVVGYYPMKLKQSCVTCHARQGLEQDVGAFGGALITEVLIKK